MNTALKDLRGGGVGGGERERNFQLLKFKSHIHLDDLNLTSDYFLEKSILLPKNKIQA